jgi:hypothetical protein
MVMGYGRARDLSAAEVKDLVKRKTGDEVYILECPARQRVTVYSDIPIPSHGLFEEFLLAKCNIPKQECGTRPDSGHRKSIPIHPGKYFARLEEGARFNIQASRNFELIRKNK